MTKDEALRMALEALLGWGKGFPDNWGDLDTEAVNAIREALVEQPAQQQYQSTADKCKLTPVPAKGGLLPAQQPERPAVQGEPFAYAYTGIKHNGEHHGPHLVWKPEYMDAMSASMGAVAVPLYTTPQPAVPERKPLSDEEILKVWEQAMVKDNGTHARLDNQPFVHFARAIEAAHGIKE